MTQDTRKDRRVKIVSLNVRYKSATVDEFIENHAHDVSRGGIYIKTGSPFPPGTLLKFEVRLASDQAVITGVGRVVWKRETSQGTAERPAGMGVKFIKIDDPSKIVIDKLMNTRSDAGKTYEAEVEASGKVSERPPAVTPAPRPVGSKTPPPAAASPRVGKSTMVGLGAVQVPHAGAPRPASSVAPARTSAVPDMFPKSRGSVPPDDSKAEPTVMKQAAELLEEALREAGGSMAEVGTNPLFAGSPDAASAQTPAVPSVAPTPQKSGADELTVHKLLSPLPPPAQEADEPLDEAAKARAMVAGMSPGASAPRKPVSDPPRTTRDSPVAKAPHRESRPPSLRPQPRASSRPSSSPPPVAKKSGGGGGVIALGVLVAVAIAAFVFRGQIFGNGAAPEPPPTASAAASAPATSASAAASGGEAPSAAASESAPSASAASSSAPGASASAAPKASGGGAAQAPAKPAAATPAPKPPTAGPAATATAASPAATAPDGRSGLPGRAPGVDSRLLTIVI